MSSRPGDKEAFNLIIDNINSCIKYGFSNPNLASVVENTLVLASQLNAVIGAINERGKIIDYKEDVSFDTKERGSLIKEDIIRRIEQVGLDIKNNMVCSGCKNICANSCSNDCLANCVKVCQTACSSGCIATCSDGCINACSTGCVSACTSSCSKGCSTGCTTACTADCSGECSYGCVSG